MNTTLLAGHLTDYRSVSDAMQSINVYSILPIHNFSFVNCID